MQDIFVRSAAILGDEGINNLQGKTVAVFGLGGVGAAAGEALARGGIGHLLLIDHDTVQKSNINRQLIALHSTLGNKKTEAAAMRYRDINPDIRLSLFPCFFDASTQQDIPLEKCDYIIDAIDCVPSKLLLAKLALRYNIPLLSCMGTANKTDPSQLRFSDIMDTAGCPLCRAVRQKCRKEGIPKLTVLFSPEPPCATPIIDEVSGRHCPGSLSFVPPVAGMMLAGRVILELTGYSSSK